MAEAGRRYVIEGRTDSELDRNEFMIRYMSQNKAFLHASEGLSAARRAELLEEYQARFAWYRKAWRGAVSAATEAHPAPGGTAQGLPLLCVSVEVAAVCDLACPFCYRQYIATPDKLVDDDLYYRLVDEAAELGVPSIKYSWRGEPILHPSLPQFVDYAKRAGILDTMVNTNAVTLDEKKSEALIDAGLDHIIFSFDGGSPETYNKMRVGRFSENTFEHVYDNIVRFCELRTEKGLVFPRTKIQMVVTTETYPEQQSFFDLFDPYIDDVSVKAYTERGGALDDLDDASASTLRRFFGERDLPDTSAYLRDIHGNLFAATGRLPCEQPFQRLMVSYDGRVSACCYDWGTEHPVGYVSPAAYDTGDADYEDVKRRSDDGAKGFELMPNLAMPTRHHEPEKKVSTLKELWLGGDADDIRRAHLDGCADSLAICRNCVFKEQYRWEEVASS